VVPYRPTLATYGEDHWRLFADDPSFPLPYVVRRGKEFPTNNLTPYQQTMLANWQQDTYAEFVLKDADAALATMTEDPYVFAIPSGTGGSGRGGVLEFYANQFLPKIPPDFEPTSLSQTFSNDRIVEEFVIRFTHTLDMDWMLPGVSATGGALQFRVFHPPAHNASRRYRSLPNIPQLVQTRKSLSSVALLAVSQLCTTRSNFAGTSSCV
jgi:hypothetical protein